MLFNEARAIKAQRMVEEAEGLGADAVIRMQYATYCYYGW